MDIDLELISSNDLVDELMKRTPAGVVILLRPNRTSDKDEFWAQHWGNHWLVLGLLDHEHEKQRQATTGLTMLSDDDDKDHA